MDGKWPGLKSQNPKVLDSYNFKFTSNNQSQDLNILELRVLKSENIKTS